MEIPKVRNYLFLFGVILVTALFLMVVWPFAYPIFWAAVIATLSYPIYNSLLKRLKRENLSALLTIFLVTLVIILPLSFIITLLVRESLNIFPTLNDNQGQLQNFITSIDHFLRTNSYLAKLNINNTVITGYINDLSRALLTFIGESVKSLTQNSLKFIGLFVLMIYTLFFFLRDGKKILAKIVHLIPMGDRYEKMLYDKFTSTTSATIKGTLLLGGLQGVLTAILFAATGVQSPIVFGLITTVFAIIPAAGSFVVWLPVAIVMMVLGHVVKGVIILASGVLVIGIIDNFLRPILVGKDLQMHPIVVLFSTLGGVFAFGVSGFVIGPVIASLFQSFWEIYEQYYSNDLNKG